MKERPEFTASASYENAEICAECGGQCCKDLPGSAYPEDFDIDTGHEKLRTAIRSGEWAIDWWEGDPGDGEVDKTAYFVRPSTKDKMGITYDGSWGGECCFLTPNGCRMPITERPRECRELEPKGGGEKCVKHNNTCKRDAALAWRKHFELLDSFTTTGTPRTAFGVGAE